MARRGLLLTLLLALGACKGAAAGAKSGAMYGALGSAVASVVWGGGDVVGDAARGAAVGATVGAVSGAAAGSQNEKAREQQAEQQKLSAENAELERRNRELELEKRLIAETGTDNTEAIRLLVQCDHGKALYHSKKAETSSTPEFRLASYWIQAVVALDRRHMEDVRALYPELVELDPDVATIEDAERIALDLLSKLEDTRAEFGLPRRCP